MNLNINVFLYFCLILSSTVHAEKKIMSKEIGPPNCNKFPGSQRSILGCCNYPFLQHDETSIRCMSDGAYVYAPTLLSNCFVHTCAFKSHQRMNSSVTEDHYLDFMIENYIHWKWLKIVSPVVEDCKITAMEDDMTKYIEPPYDINPDRCFFPYLSFATCIYTIGFRNCQGDMWLKSKTCQKWMTFFNTCDSLESTPKLLEVVPFLNF